MYQKVCFIEVIKLNVCTLHGLYDVHISLFLKKKVKLREDTILETLKIDEIPAISIIYVHSDCLLFVSNRTKFFCGISHDPRGGLWMIKISKFDFH